MTANNVMLKRRTLIHVFNELKHHRVVAVCAPAGYGKTVAVTEWLSKDTRAKAIFSLDEYDNNISGFCERFCATLSRCQPQNQTLSEIISHTSFQNSPDVFTFRAVASLSCRKQTVVAIDDLHLINDNEVLRLLLVLIKRLPKNFQIILISRYELPTDFSDLWAKEEFAIVGTEQLLFSDDDVKALYDKRGKQITQAQAREINQQAHGWAIGIKASLLSDDESFDKTYSFMEDFVRKNIWEKWDDATRDFMIRTAFLRDLTPSLCEAITGVPDCAKFLKKLVRKGAFITQTQKGIYRYHHLFRQFLKNIAGEYGADFEMGLLEKEGHWHLSQEDFYSAIECFIQNKNHDGIEQCFALLNASPRIAAKRVLPILKHREFTRAAKKHPHLLYFVAYAALIEGRASDAAAFMDEYYVRFPEIVSRYPGLVHGIHFMRIVDFRFTIYQMTDRITTPEDLAKVPIHIWRLSMHISMMHRGINDLSELALGDVLDNIKCRLLPKLSWLYAGGFGADIKIIAAGLLYEQGKLFEAYEHAFDAYAILEQHPFSDTKQCTLLLLTDILDALGDKEGADTFLQSVPKMIEKERAYHLYDNFNAFIIRRKIVADKVEDVEDWLNAKTTDSLFLWEIYVAVTTCRAFIFIKKYDSAILLLKRVLEMATQFIRPSDIIEARILLSIAYWKKKRGLQKKALEQLDAAVSLAYKYDFVQMFIYNGAELADMLYKLLKQIEQRKDKHYISFVKILHMKTRSYLMRETTDEDFCNINPIDFTDRQSSITNLLCQGKTYKEIAEFLGIKQSSVASHIKLIYKKLDVKTAADAVAKVNAMNLGIAHQ